MSARPPPRGGSNFKVNYQFSIISLFIFVIYLFNYLFIEEDAIAHGWHYVANIRLDFH